MKNLIRLVVLIRVFLATAHAQYVPSSPYLQDPDLAIPYVDSCASFWVQVFDSARGGFYTNVDRFGNVITAWGTNKNLVTNSRNAYGFTRAYMLTGDEHHLVMARNALGFLYQHAWDTAYGGWFSTLDVNGTPTNRTADKSAFDQHYALLGIAAYYEATHDSLDWRWLMQGYESNETHLWDGNPQNFGYYDYGTYNWTSRSAKSFNATVDAITTHVLSLYLMTGEERFRTRLLELTDNMLRRLVGSMAQHAIGFVEHFNMDWTWTNNPANYNTRTIMGHVLKTAWCLGRMHQILPDTTFVAGAESLALQVLARGYDHTFGGPYKDYDRVTGQMFMYGQADTAKAWWQMEQAITAGLMLYEITGDEQYLRMADKSLDFFMTYFVDHQYREVYADRTRRGGQIWGLEKGSSGKAGYHSIETGYYVYLYGNLFLQQRPVSLHYMLMADSTDRTLRMNPVAFATNRYRIQEVLLNGATYADFDALSRLLHLPPGTGGHFEVTYEPVNPNAVTTNPELPGRAELAQNYPNPFNPSTTIRYTLSEPTSVDLRVMNLLGKEVATLVNETQGPGEKSVRFNAMGLPSGVYFYQLRAGEVRKTKKLVLLK